MSVVTEWRKSRVRGYVSVVEPAAESVSQSVGVFCSCCSVLGDESLRDRGPGGGGSDSGILARHFRGVEHTGQPGDSGGVPADASLSGRRGMP